MNAKIAEWPSSISADQYCPIDQMLNNLNDFYPLMKVSLNGEYGVVINHSAIKNHTFDNWENNDPNIFGIIRWDTRQESDFEDWRGLWGTFVAQGGCEIDKDYLFQFISDDGTFKAQ